MKVPRWFSHPVTVNYGFSLFAFIAGIGLTIFAWQWSLDNQTAIERVQFRQAAQQAADVLQDRFGGYGTLVRSGQALFVSSNDVEPAEWQQFVQGLDLARNFPAVVAFDYLVHVPDGELAAYERKVRRKQPGFSVHHIEANSMHCIVQYEAPLRPDSPAPGGDACSWPKLAEMIKKTIATSAIATSVKVVLNTRPEQDNIGIVVTGPIYNEEATSDSRLPSGWVSAVLSVKRLLVGLLPAESNIHLSVFGATGGKRQWLWSSSGTPAPDTCRRPFLGTPCLRMTVPLELPGRSWSLVFQQPGAVALGAWKVAAAGFVISLLLGLTFFRWGRVRVRALALATEMTDALRQSENMLSSVTNNIFEGIYRATYDEGLVYINKSLATMFGYRDVEEMRSVSGAILYADPRRRDELRALLEENGYYRGEEVEFVRRDGSHFIGVNNALAVYDDDGRILYWDGAISDVTARRAVEERVWYLARYDSLTGLANRASFRERVRQEINRAARASGQIAILFLDLDRFKTVNDYLGHHAGDKLLKAVSQRIQACLGRDDVASRQGGDEFLILLADVQGSEAVVAAAEEMLEAVAGGYTIDAHDITVTPSIGISIYPAHGDTVEALISNADAAMYHAKARGRYNVQLFTPELDADRQLRVGLENDLREALSQNQFVLHYQPQVELATGRIIGVEALLRWQHPEKGMISPAEFIPVAEQSGLIVPIGEWVLREACRQNREWQLDRLPIVPIAVNISAVQFLRRTLDQTILEALSAANLKPRYLELELTETVVMQDIARTVDVLNKLQSAGIRFAIDDFGTGYSSLSYLRCFKINKLKIDQSFVRELTSNPEDVAIIDAIIGLAGNFKLRVLAEGVETAEQLEFLRGRACDDVQGFYFSRPVAADEFARLLQAKTITPASEAAVS
ncbi:MAG TPA: EAL domain-containing protein [Gammaproteobacteria bacterium]|nr:EAL domain-containing protein [Gammaproteobacteria bacterium]